MNVVVDLPNEKLAKQFLAAKPANLDVKTTTKGSTVTVNTKAPAKKAKKIGVVGVSKAENVQLGLILKEIAYQFKEYNDGSDIYLRSSVLVDPEALIKLFGRYQNKAK